MTELNVQDVSLIFGGLLFAIVSMFIILRAISKMYHPLIAPLARVLVDEDEQLSIPYLNGIFSLYAVFVVCAMIFAFTGGAIAGIWVPIQSGKATQVELELIRSHLIFGFTAGILVAALARIRAVYTSTSLARHLELLTVATVGLLAFLLLVNPKFITILIDAYVRPAGGRYFPAFAFLISAASLGAVEILIALGKTMPKANTVPYSLLRERIEQQTEVEQVFWPSDVTKFTTRTLSRIITKEGLTEICWLSNTGPPDHMPAALDSLKQWLWANRRDVGDVEDCARKIISTVARAIVTTAVAEKRLKDLGYVPRVHRLKGPLRVRLLIINAKYAIVHLPIPFTGSQNEQSNCATLISSPELVQPLHAVFDGIWEDRYVVETIESLTWLLASKDSNPLRIAAIVYANHGPTRVEDLAQDLSLRYGTPLGLSDVSKYIDQLELNHLLRKIGSEWVAPSRYSQTCRSADVFRRIGL